MENKLEKAIQTITGVDENIQGVLVPLLRDTINDYRKVTTKLVMLLVLTIVLLGGVIVYSQFLLAEQADKYNEFFSQFEFEYSDVYQDILTGDNYSGDAIINNGIDDIK